MTDATLTGACFCGTVQLEVTGEPVAMGYCHCGDCRHWSAGPINTFSLWPPEAVKVTAGAQAIGTYNKTERSYRKWCTQCGGHLFSEHPGMGLTDVYAPVLAGLHWQPQMHVFYAEKMVSVKDGLPKHRDIPAEMGGSGEMLPE